MNLDDAKQNILFCSAANSTCYNSLRVTSQFRSKDSDKSEKSRPLNAIPLDSERIRLMLVHGRVLFRTVLACMLAAARDFELVAECANAQEAAESLGSSRPDVILFDFDIWQDLISPVRDVGYHGKFLAVAEEVATGPCARALSEGVAGVVLSSDSPASLVLAIHVVSSGGAWLDRNLIQLLAARYPLEENSRLDGLPAREQSVLKGILGGLSNRQIADEIGTSESTVKAILRRLFDKTGVRSRSQLVTIMFTLPRAFARHAESRSSSND